VTMSIQVQQEILETHVLKVSDFLGHYLGKCNLSKQPRFRCPTSKSVSLFCEILAKRRDKYPGPDVLSNASMSARLSNLFHAGSALVPRLFRTQLLVTDSQFPQNGGSRSQHLIKLVVLPILQSSADKYRFDRS